MKTKRSQINASVTGECKQELESILAHHYREGHIKMSMTKIMEDLIHKEAKRLKVGAAESRAAG